MSENVSKLASKPTMTVSQIMARYDKSSVYVKRALQKGWLAGHKVLMAGTQVYQWVAFVEDVEAWRKSAEQHKASKARFTGSERDMNDLQAYLKNAKPEQIEALRKSLENKAH
jgi:hypothetical protein